MDKRSIGSDFDDFLRNEGILEEADAVATKRVTAYQIAQEMEKANISQSERAASAVGKRLQVQLTV